MRTARGHRRAPIPILAALGIALPLHAAAFAGLAAGAAGTPLERPEPARTSLAFRRPLPAPEFRDPAAPVPRSCLGCGYYEKGMRHPDACGSPGLGRELEGAGPGSASVRSSPRR